MSLEDTLYPLLKLYEAAPQPVKSLAGRAYRAIPASWRYGAAYTRFQNEAREVETWDAASGQASVAIGTSDGSCDGAWLAAGARRRRGVGVGSGAARTSGARTPGAAAGDQAHHPASKQPSSSASPARRRVMAGS